MKIIKSILTILVLSSILLTTIHNAGVSLVKAKPIEIKTNEIFTSDVQISAEPSELNQTPTEPEIRLLSSSDAGVIFEVLVPWELMKLETELVNGKEYTQISLPGWFQTSQAGAPELPILVEQIGAPFGASISVDAIPGFAHTQKLLNPILPRVTQVVDWPIPSETNESPVLPAPTYVYIEDQKIYEGQVNYPGKLTEVTQDGVLRQQRVIGIGIYPFQYDPKSMDLVIYESMRITVSFSGVMSRSNQASPDDSPVFENLLETQLLNYESSREWRGLEVLTYTQEDREAIRDVSPWTPPDPGWRIKVRTEGMYKLTYAELMTAGFPVTSLNPRTFQLYSMGTEVAIHVEGEEDNQFNTTDYILFYGQGITSKYTLDNVYWLTYGKTNQGLRMGSRNVTPGTAPIPAYSLAEKHTESNLQYFSWLPGDENLDRWLWKVINAPTAASWTYPFSLAAPYTGPATMTISLVGYTSFTVTPDHHAQVLLNGTLIGDAMWDGRTWKTLVMPISAGLLQTSNSLIVKTPNDLGTGSDVFIVDWIDLDYPSSFQAESNKLGFVYSSPGAWKFQTNGLTSANGFTTDKVLAFDISDPLNLGKLTGVQVFSSGSSYFAQFEDTVSGTEKYWVTSSTAFQSVQAIEADTSSNIHMSAIGADHIIITHNTFSTQAQTLTDFRSSQGLRAIKVDIQDVYDEFGFGIAGTQPIKYFLSYAYSYWPQPAPSYVVLIGDGNYDPKKNITTSVDNFISPYLVPVDYTIGETAADNRYVTLVGDDLMPDMMLGRLSVGSTAEASAIINKIIAYEQAPMALWQQEVLAIADNYDEAGDFDILSDSLLSCCFPPAYQVERVYLYETHSTIIGAQAAIKGSNTNGTGINGGKILVNYIGHGASTQWADEQLFKTSDVPLLVNSGKYPVVLAMTCWEGYYIYPTTNDALGEVVTNASEKGAVASWSPTGLGVADGHDYLNVGFFNGVFSQGLNTIGEATQAGKLALFTAGASPDLLDTFILFGDPATKIARTLKAVDDQYTVEVNNTLNISIPGVLTNDIDLNASPMTAVLVSSPANGNLTLNANGSFIYTPNANFSGIDRFRYRANNGSLLSNIATVTITVTDGTVYTHIIALEQGWNLVSFNLLPTSTAIEDVLVSIAGNFTLVYAWDAATQEWLAYNPSAPINDLQNLDPAMGFWVEATTGDLLIVQGTPPTSTNIPLKVGWNLVGYPSTAAQVLPGVLTNNGVSNYIIVMAYDAADSEPWEMYDPLGPPYVNDLLELTPGRGYWINVSQDSIWNVTFEP